MLSLTNAKRTRLVKFLNTRSWGHIVVYGRTVGNDNAKHLYNEIAGTTKYRGPFIHIIKGDSAIARDSAIVRKTAIAYLLKWCYKHDATIAGMCVMRRTFDRYITTIIGKIIWKIQEKLSIYEK